MGNSHLNETVSNYFDHSPDPENEALNLLHYLRGRFNWSGTVMTREDVVTQVGREVTDEEFERVADTRAWRDLFSNDYVMEAVWDGVSTAISAAGIEEEDEDGR